MPGVQHKPVLLAEVVASLQCRPGGRYVDGTIGMGGHAAAILRASAPTGWLYGCDRDGDALEEARQRLAVFAGRFELRRDDFANLAEWIPKGSCDGVVLDLGMSSFQIEQAERGFSFQKDGPLDMRMDTRQPLTAASLLNQASETELRDLFWTLGGEPRAARLARALVEARATQPFSRTLEVARLVERVAPRPGKGRHPATRVFQALRMAVNHETDSLRAGLKGCLEILKPGGRAAFITFHSGEDRIVKEFGREASRGYDFPGTVDVPELRQERPVRMRWVQRKAITASPGEILENPRARSAQLRVLEKV